MLLIHGLLTLTRMATQGGGCLSQVLKALVGGLSAPTKAAHLPYRAKARFVSANEALVFNALERHSDSRVVFANVLMRDLVEVTPQRDRSAWQTAHNRIAQRQVDFVVCDRATFRPLLAIELDDSTHDTARRSQSDRLEDEIFRAAGLPFLRLRGRYEPAQIVALIESALHAPEVPSKG